MYEFGYATFCPDQYRAAIEEEGRPLSNIFVHRNKWDKGSTLPIVTQIRSCDTRWLPLGKHRLVKSFVTSLGQITYIIPFSLLQLAGFTPDSCIST